MKKHVFLLALVLFFVGGLLFMQSGSRNGNHIAIAQEKGTQAETIQLPEPKYDGEVSVEKALLERRSIRDYKEDSLTVSEISQILWAAQGITDPKTGHRTAPSAMASYLLNVYVLPGKVIGLPMGLYRYEPAHHELTKVTAGDMKAKLFDAAGQAPIQKAPAALVITGLNAKTKNPNWFYLEAGHAAQNVYLEGVSLNIGTVVMGGFKEDAVKKALNIPADETVIYIMPLGKKK
jgi:SagB-type dehydrogenase family enzyme